MESNKQRILSYLREYRAFYGYNPTYREIADGLGVSLGTVSRHVAMFKRTGIMTSTKKWRSLELVRRFDIA